MMLSLIRIMWITGIRQNVEITISSRLLEPEQSPAEDGSHLGEKLFWGRKKKKSTIFNLFNIYPCFSPHANIPAVSCLTGATAESIIQHVSKTPHHISAEEKKKALYHLQTNLAAGTLLRESVCGRTQQQSFLAE